MATEQAKISKWENELIPNIVDHLASVTPTAPYAEYPISPITYDEGYRTVTYKDFASAINGLAWWLEQKLGKGQNFEVLAYIGPNDLRYTALILGAVKAGYVLFLTSPRNSTQAHRELFTGLKCRTLLTSSPKPPATDTILSAHTMRHIEVPNVEDLLDKSYPPYPFNKTYETAYYEPLWVIHTSGSTGIPKPLIWTHETGVRNMNFLARDPPVGIESLERMWQGKRVMITFPPFHGACLVAHMFNAIPFGTVMIAPVAGAIATAQGVADALKQTPVDMALLVPSIISELSQSPALLEYCAERLQLVLYCGGDLPKDIGDKVAAKIPLRCLYGASEIGIVSHLLPSQCGPLDWRYVHFHPCLGFDFEEVADGGYEMVVKRDPTKKDTQSTFTIGPQLRTLQDEYRSRDLFEPHPTIPNMWCWRARADDIIVFLNGEKTNPVSMEQHIVARNSNVAATLVVGAQKFQAALLVEPISTEHRISTSEEAAFIEQIWPSIEEANAEAPAHARIEKQLVLLTTPGKPMIRAGKGTIQRAASVQQYSKEIDILYKNADVALDQDEDGSDCAVPLHDPRTVSRIIRAALSLTVSWTPDTDTDNFFALGMDSLQALRLTRRLRRELSNRDIALTTVYGNPSVSQLTQAITMPQKQNRQSGAGRGDSMEAIFEEYEGLVNEIPLPSKSGSPRSSVLLTGSTGTLGTYLLHSLLADPTIAHVYCLNRRDDSESVQQDKSEAAGFSLSESSNRLTFFKADLAQRKLGLDDVTYNTLRSHIGLIIHNAWPVNFNLSLPSFRPQLTGLINLFEFSAQCACPARVFFISSVSSVWALHANEGSIPEAVVESLDAPMDVGYAKSKFLAEKLCSAAAHRVRIPISIARVGQIAGPVRGPGLWNPTEWFPSLMMSSMHLNALPDDLGASLNDVSWMPVDTVADAIAELASGNLQSDLRSEVDRENSVEVYNVLNPHPTTWTELLPAIKSSIDSVLKESIEVMRSEKWLAKVRHSLQAALQQGGGTKGADPSAVQDDGFEALLSVNPAIKLLEFYQASMADKDSGGQRWELGQALARSGSLRNMPGIGTEWMRKWISEWLAARPQLTRTTGKNC